jgi:hypothetical protein
MGCTQYRCNTLKGSSHQIKNACRLFHWIDLKFKVIRFMFISDLYVVFTKIFFKMGLIHVRFTPGFPPGAGFHGEDFAPAVFEFAPYLRSAEQSNCTHWTGFLPVKLSSLRIGNHAGASLSSLRSTLEQPGSYSSGNGNPERSSSGVLEARWSKLLPGKSCSCVGMHQMPQRRSNSFSIRFKKSLFTIASSY